MVLGHLVRPIWVVWGVILGAPGSHFGCLGGHFRSSWLPWSPLWTHPAPHRLKYLNLWEKWRHNGRLLGPLGHPWGSFGEPERPLVPIWGALGRLFEDFSGVGGHSENRCPSRAKTYFLRFRGASGAPNGHFWAHVGAIMVPSGALEPP